MSRTMLSTSASLFSTQQFHTHEFNATSSSSSSTQRTKDGCEGKKRQKIFDVLADCDTADPKGDYRPITGGATNWIEEPSCDRRQSNFCIEDLSPLSSSSSSSLHENSLDEHCNVNESGKSRDITLHEDTEWYEGLSPLSTESITSTKLNTYATTEFNPNDSHRLLPPHPISYVNHNLFHFPSENGWPSDQRATGWPGLCGKPLYPRNPHATNSDIDGYFPHGFYDCSELIVAGRPLTSPRRADVQGIPILLSPRNNYYLLDHRLSQPQLANKHAAPFDCVIPPLSSRLMEIETPQQSNIHRSASIGTLSTSTAGDMRPPGSETMGSSEKESLDYLADCLLPARLLIVPKLNRGQDQTPTKSSGNPTKSTTDQTQMAKVAFILQIMICWRCRLLCDSTSSQASTASTGEGGSGKQVSASNNVKAPMHLLPSGKSLMTKSFGNDMVHIQGQSWAQILEEEFLNSSNGSRSKVYWIQPTSFENAECYSKVLCTPSGADWKDADSSPSSPVAGESFRPAYGADLFEKMCSCSSSEYSEFTGALTLISELVADLLADREERCSKCEEQYPLPIIICHDQELTKKFANGDLHKQTWEKSFETVPRRSFCLQAGSSTAYKNSTGFPPSMSNYSSMNSTVDTVWSSRTLPNSPVGAYGGGFGRRNNGPRPLNVAVYRGKHQLMQYSDDKFNHTRTGSEARSLQPSQAPTATVKNINGMTSSPSAPNFQSSSIINHMDQYAAGGNSHQGRQNERLNHKKQSKWSYKRELTLNQQQESRGQLASPILGLKPSIKYYNSTSSTKGNHNKLSTH